MKDVRDEDLALSDKEIVRFPNANPEKADRFRFAPAFPKTKEPANEMSGPLDWLVMPGQANSVK